MFENDAHDLVMQIESDFLDLHGQELTPQQERILLSLARLIVERLASSSHK